MSEWDAGALGGEKSVEGIALGVWTKRVTAFDGLSSGYDNGENIVPSGVIVRDVNAVWNSSEVLRVFCGRKGVTKGSKGFKTCDTFSMSFSNVDACDHAETLIAVCSTTLGGFGRKLRILSARKMGYDSVTNSSKSG